MTRAVSGVGPDVAVPVESGIRSARRRVLAVAAIALAGKLTLAATTHGTNDIGHWLQFLKVVSQHGPIGVYGVSLPYKVGQHTIQLYNHPPLIGYFLELVRALTNVGLSAQFTIRAASSLADVATALVVFELLRVRRSLREATVSAVVVSVSPVLVVISGFHGNTDPIFIMLALLSAYLLADRHSPLLAGAAMAMSLGVKIVPVVLVPTLLVYALLSGRRTVVRYLIGLIGVSLCYWGPALLLQGTRVRQDVLGYAGLNSHEWGLDLLARDAKNPGLMSSLEGGSRLLIVALCALAPAVLVWRRPRTVVLGVALSLSAFLALTPSFGTQYLAWGAAPTLLLTAGGGLVFNALAGLLVLHVYNRWSGGLPWYNASASVFTHGENVLGLFAWASVCVSAVLGGRQMITAPRCAIEEPSNARSIADSTAPPYS